MVAKVFNTYTFTATLGAGEIAESEASKSAIRSKLKEVRQCVKKLIVSVFIDAELIDKIIEAKRLNDYNEFEFLITDLLQKARDLVTWATSC